TGTCEDVRRAGSAPCRSVSSWGRTASAPLFSELSSEPPWWVSNPPVTGEARGNRGCLHKGFHRGGDSVVDDLAGSGPRRELGLEDRLGGPPDRARVCVEVAQVLPSFQGVLLQLANPLTDDRVRRRISGSDDLMRGEQLVVDRGTLQPGGSMGPFDEVDQILLARIDPGVPDDPQESDDPPERCEELILSGDPPDAAPALEARREGILVRSGELARSNLLQHRQELELPLERDSLGDADERRADEAQEAR